MMLDLPELFVPNRPVSGASRSSPVSAQLLKFSILSDVSIAELLYGLACNRARVQGGAPGSVEVTSSPRPGWPRHRPVPAEP